MVAHLRFLAMLSFWRNADTTTKDKRVSSIAFVVQDRAVDGGNADLVAIILHPGHHTGLNAARMQNTFRQGIWIQVLRAKTEHVCVRNWLRRNTKDIAYYAADARVRSAKGLYRGRMV